MSLPEPVIELAATVVPEAEDQGKLAFAYAYGPILSGIGEDDEVGLVCVWEQQATPERASQQARHLTQKQFDELLEHASTEQDFTDPERLRLGEIADFAYGVLLSDDDGAGTTARGNVWDFPPGLVIGSQKALHSDLETMPGALTAANDSWERADLLSGALQRAYVAWFAAHEYYFPGRRRRREYAAHFGLGTEVCDLEQQIWQALDAGELAGRFTAFAERILADH